MSSYVTLTMRTDTFDQILNNLRFYCSNLDEYYEIENTVHLIDFLFEEYFKSTEKQDKEYKEWEKYENLFLEHFENEDYLDNDGKINEKGVYEYKNFNKVNNVLNDFKEGGVLDILDEKRQFILVLRILDILGEKQ